MAMATGSRRHCKLTSFHACAFCSHAVHSRAGGLHADDDAARASLSHYMQALACGRVVHGLFQRIDGGHARLNVRQTRTQAICLHRLCRQLTGHVLSEVSRCVPGLSFVCGEATPACLVVADVGARLGNLIELRVVEYLLVVKQAQYRDIIVA